MTISVGPTFSSNSPSNESKPSVLLDLPYDLFRQSIFPYLEDRDMGSLFLSSKTQANCLFTVYQADLKELIQRKREIDLDVTLNRFLSDKGLTHLSSLTVLSSDRKKEKENKIEKILGAPPLSVEKVQSILAMSGDLNNTKKRSLALQLFLSHQPPGLEATSCFIDSLELASLEEASYRKEVFSQSTQGLTFLAVHRVHLDPRLDERIPMIWHDLNPLKKEWELQLQTSFSRSKTVETEARDLFLKDPNHATDLLKNFCNDYHKAKFLKDLVAMDDPLVFPFIEEILKTLSHDEIKADIYATLLGKHICSEAVLEGLSTLISEKVKLFLLPFLIEKAHSPDCLDKALLIAKTLYSQKRKVEALKMLIAQQNPLLEQGGYLIALTLQSNSYKKAASEALIAQGSIEAFNTLVKIVKSMDDDSLKTNVCFDLIENNSERASSFFVSILRSLDDSMKTTLGIDLLTRFSSPHLSKAVAKIAQEIQNATLHDILIEELYPKLLEEKEFTLLLDLPPKNWISWIKLHRWILKAYFLQSIYEVVKGESDLFGNEI